MVTVQVFSKSSGAPARDCRVSVCIGWSDVYTEYSDSDGEAHFDSVSPGECEIIVDGASVFKGRIEGRKIVYT